jgi:hypothetical protein
MIGSGLHGELHLMRSILNIFSSQSRSYNAPASLRSLVTLGRPRPWATRGDRIRVVYRLVHFDAMG